MGDGDRQPSQQTKMLNLFFGSDVLRGRYDAGHLIANDLGGPGHIANLVPMEKVFNENRAWKQMELWIKDCLSKKSCTIKNGVHDC